MLERLTQTALNLAGIGLLLMMLLIVIDVAAKYIFNSPIPGVLELVAFYFMTMVVFLPLATAQKNHQHLVVDLFTRSLSRKATAVLNMLAGIISLVYLGLFVWGSFQQAVYMTSINQSAEILDQNLIIWPVLWVLPISIILMMNWIARQTLKNFIFVFHGLAHGAKDVS